jgi:hypothetical protein
MFRREVKSPERAMRMEAFKLTGNSTVMPLSATGVLNLTADITLTSVAVGAARNTTTFTIQVLAAAANPTDTVLVAFTGTAAAIVCTVTPNDGTNNAATPVDLTTAELRELITTGAVVGKTITLTDASSLRALQTATGGGATALADGGEGDGVAATFADGVTSAVALVEGKYRATVAVSDNTPGVYTFTFTDLFARTPCICVESITSAVNVHVFSVSTTGFVLKTFLADDGTTAKNADLLITAVGADTTEST